MGRSYKQRMKMKKLQEARKRATRQRVQHAGVEGAGVRLVREEEEVLEPADRAGPDVNTPPPPQPSTSSTSSKPASRSSLKLENTPSLDFEEKNSQRYQIVDIDNLLEWRGKALVAGKNKPLYNDLTM